MEGTQSKKYIIEMLWLSYLAITLILSKTYNHEKIGERPIEQITKICGKAINYSTHGTIKHVYFKMVDNASYWKEQNREESVMKIDSLAPLMSSWLGKYEIHPTLLLPKRMSELTLLPHYSAAALHISCIMPDSRHRMKREDPTIPTSPADPSKETPSPDNPQSKETKLDKNGNYTTPTSTSTDQAQGGWPMWVWIVIAVAAILVIIAVIISIIVCINMNKTEEIPPSAAESAESFGSSESEESQEEGERRLRRGRRQIAACSYCPQTLQRFGSDGPSCGRNCCNTELNEQRHISNAL